MSGSVEENKQAVSTLFELFQEKPFPTDKVKTYFGPEVTSRRIETGTFHGSNDEFVGYFGHMMTNMFPNAKFTTRRIVGDGDQVWIWALGEGAYASVRTAGCVRVH